MCELAYHGILIPKIQRQGLICGSSQTPDFMIYKEMDGNRDVIMTSRRSSDNVFITKT